MARRAHGRDHRGIHAPSPSPSSADHDRHWGPPPWRGPVRHWRRARRHGPFQRRDDGRMLAGIGVELSARTGLDVNAVRVGLVLFGLLSGVGVAAYVAGWLLLPAKGQPETIGSRALRDGRGLALAAALIPVLILSLLLASALDSGWLGSLAWPLMLSAAGLVLIWRNGSDGERALLRRATAPLTQIGAEATRSWKVLVVRSAAGVALAVGGVVVLSVGRHDALLRPLAGVALVLGAFVVVFGPWWLNIGRQLVLERQGRLRAEEAADLAARVHDSVLQTLAMIQRHAEEPQRVAQLARAQERELRSWLFEGRAPGSFDELATLSAAVHRIQADVEAAHGIPVEVVVVGDCPLEGLDALLAAGREATVNAAKWSQAPVVSLFAEVETETEKVSLFVRDRGRGFDPSAVAEDRRGIAQSIHGRMRRAGGTATIRSSPGAGTEVELTMPRRAK